MKTHRGSAKRFTVGARGKLTAGHAKSSHLMSGRRAKTRRRLSGNTILSGRLAKRVVEFLGEH